MESLDRIKELLLSAIVMVDNLREQYMEDGTNVAVQEGEYIDPAYCAQYREECKDSPCPDCLLVVPFNV